jgi:hypothetical protein
MSAIFSHPPHQVSSRGPDSIPFEHPHYRSSKGLQEREPSEYSVAYVKFWRSTSSLVCVAPVTHVTINCSLVKVGKDSNSDLEVYMLGKVSFRSAQM